MRPYEKRLVLVFVIGSLVGLAVSGVVIGLCLWAFGTFPFPWSKGWVIPVAVVLLYLMCYFHCIMQVRGVRVGPSGLVYEAFRTRIQIAPDRLLGFAIQGSPYGEALALRFLGERGWIERTRECVIPPEVDLEVLVQRLEAYRPGVMVDRIPEDPFDPFKSQWLRDKGQGEAGL